MPYSVTVLFNGYIILQVILIVPRVMPFFLSLSEYAEKGCLYDYLAKGPSTDFHQVLQWSQQIALGMNYLHCEAPAHVIHRDLKSRNSECCHCTK